MQQHHLSSRSPTRDGGGRSTMTHICVMVSTCTMARSPVAPLPTRLSCLTRPPIRHCTFPPMMTDRPTAAGTDDHQVPGNTNRRREQHILISDGYSRLG